MAGVTLTEVARRAGVSQPTASRVLNGSIRKPAQHVVDAVRRAADDLGYVPNAQAQALVRSDTGLLGLVVHDIADPYFSAIAAGAQEAAATQGRQTMLAATQQSPEQELAAVETFIARRVDALVLAGSRRASTETTPVADRLGRSLEQYMRNGGRVAIVGQAIAGAHAVVPDNQEGAAALARALGAEAPRDFIVLGGPPELTTAVDRTAGFVAGLAAEGLEPRAVVPGQFTRDGGYESAVHVMHERGLGGEASTCLFAVNDVMALGAMTALLRAGLRVPHDAQVAGFDDIPTLRDHNPGLSTVRLPLHAMGMRAVEIALREPGSGAAVEHVAGEVVLRESTTPPVRTNISE